MTGSGLRTFNRQQSEVKLENSFWTNQDGNISVQFFCSESEIYYQPHTHSDYAILVCLEGKVSKNQLGQTVEVGPGEAMICNYGVEYSSRYLSHNGKPCEAISLSLDHRALATLTKDFHLTPSTGDICPAFIGKVKNATLHDCAKAISGELSGHRPGRDVVIETLATRLLVETVRLWPAEDIVEIKADSSARLSRRDFLRAHEFMRSCRKEDFRLQHLCQFLGTSQERFARLFLATTHHTPANFYTLMLLERARDLLSNPKLSIKEISFELGFKTSSHFVATFRREFATSPQEYRQCNISGLSCYNRVKSVVRN